MQRPWFRLLICGSSSATSNDPLDDDPLTHRLTEVDELEAVLRSVEAYCIEMQATLARLDEAPDPMLKYLEKYAAEDDATNQGFKSLTLFFNAGGRRLRSAEVRLGDVVQRIRESMCKCTAVRDAAVARRDAWTEKLRCEAEVQVLHRRIGPKYSMDEKSARLKANHDAGLAFKQATEDLQQLLHDVVKQRWTENIAPMLVELCRIQAVLFDSADHSKDEFQKLVDSCMPCESRNVQVEEDLEKASASEDQHGALQRCPYGETFDNADEFESIIKKPVESERAVEKESTVVSDIKQLLEEAQIDVRMHCSLSRSSKGDEEYRESNEVFETLADVRSLPTVKNVASFSPVVATAPTEDALLPTLLNGRYQKQALYKVGEKLSFEAGETVEVWSSTKASWLTGLVEDVFTDGGEDEGYIVPVGVVKVSSDAGIKYIRPAQFGTSLRKKHVREEQASSST